MILTAHQPVYLPWLGLFHKIVIAEQFCIFDIAQYQTKDFINRNKVKTNNGAIWLSVPVESKNHLEKKICDVKIINNGWNKKHFRTIDLAYRKTPFFKDYAPQLEQILLGTEYTYLAELNFSILKFGLEALGIDIPICRASDFDFQGKKSDLVLDMCMKLGAKHYVFGSQGKNYANVDSFVDQGISIEFQEYNHPVYNQMFGDFEPFMSIIDLLFNHGPESYNILMSGNKRKAGK